MPQSDEEAHDQSKYRGIFDSMLGLIQTGQLPAGSRMQTEEELGKEFGASRVTVNRAMRELQLLGKIERRPGAGSFVTASETRQSFGLLIPGLGQTRVPDPARRVMSPCCCNCCMALTTVIRLTFNLRVSSASLGRPA